MSLYYTYKYYIRYEQTKPIFFCFTRGVLTAERHYWDGVKLILWSDVRPHADNKNISKAGDGRYNPDKHSLYDAS